MPTKTLVLVNTTGRQAASVARVASALGYHVRAHVYQKSHPVALELAQLENVTVVEGSLDDTRFVAKLFNKVQRAFINTVSFGDELAIGKSLADAAKKAGIQHYIYSSMPDHSVYRKGWPALPMWSVKFTVENYIRQIGLPATFVYAGIYNNNFTSLPYPLFCMKLLPDATFEWKAPFHPHTPLPWLDAEHDVGPAVLQLIKDGPKKWNNHRVPLAFELLSPDRVCYLFSRALNRRVNYQFSPTIDIEVTIPNGYREQLQGLEVVFGKYDAPYFGPELEDGDRGRNVEKAEDDADDTVVQESRALWGGWRGMEEYAREVFPLEESNNGLTWMKEDEGNDDMNNTQ
ncbi:uncharacterized protein KY384_005324 [Bacidia gigantensis]|uniref:uncharacterized protein n=1 Tax=Bacidia gigantensis TaxID=2732470 RepID=UPI001D05A0CD|nr:uncharacterized protein KY384_005324 [Bacidia gigantensis]KAG8529843.1 hypothetical protein KY384_005324 [Bacidia gigantensis]